MVGLIRDHDFLETKDSWIFCVVGDIHPPGKFFSYLKYVPGIGPWRRGGESFSRIFSDYSMNEFKKILEYLKNVKPEFVEYDPVIGTEMSSVPMDFIKRHYNCLEGLRELINRGPRDRLEKLTVNLLEEICGHGDLHEDDFGITGSILLQIHHERSDIDLIVYGRREFWKTIEILGELGYLGVRSKEQALRRMLKHYPITLSDASRLVDRIKYRGVYRGVEFSIHGVRKSEEITEKYSDKIYRKIGLAHAILEIDDVSDSCFNPAIYKVRGSAKVGGKEYHVEQLMCYDLTFSAMFEKGDKIEAYGKLEFVTDKLHKRSFHSLLIGSIEAAGREYIKLV
ncbi:MAG: hypothetical protein DRN49_01415 [Thaumarchaeota archaeon]|nr:MAG: hypothetical protein DRN49_01415 [Nitrososphaerota archaeon]